MRNVGVFVFGVFANLFVTNVNQLNSMSNVQRQQATAAAAFLLVLHGLHNRNHADLERTCFFAGVGAMALVQLFFFPQAFLVTQAEDYGPAPGF